jgi:enterochelin esterase-like enzyme
VPDAPLVDETGVTFTVADPDQPLGGVRLAADRGFPPHDAEFTRAGDAWTLRLARPPLQRFEYQLELRRRDGGAERVTDPGNPDTAPGAFGEKSVVLLPGYAPPAWLSAARVDGRFDELAPRVLLWSPDGADPGRELPLLVAHDGIELGAFARLTDYAAAMIAAGRLPPHRVALLAPGDRDQEYSASARYARVLCLRTLPSLRDAVAAAGAPVGLGVSLGALALLHAHRRHPGAFGALFLQSGSFFVPRFDAHEAGFVRYKRIVRFVQSVLRGDLPATRVPTVLTCGELEENAPNNRAMARALGAPLHLVPDLHNYTAWRDALDPHLTTLLARVWA